MPVQSTQHWTNGDTPDPYGAGALAVDSQSGTTIGNGTYTIEAILGQGGMGVVYAGVHNWTGRAVAIKVLRREVTESVDVARVLQEARAATAVAHPNVVEVLDMGRDPDGRVYLVFERLSGETLADVLDRDGMLSPEETAEILLPVLDALAVAHELGIVHRDIKPENIFLASDANGAVRPKLLDFGLAKMERSNGHSTQNGVISGTPAYMSPERAIGKRETGAETDVWSMGVVLFECLTNRLPFSATHPMGILLAVVNDPVPSLSEESHVPSALADVVDAALRRDVASRLPDGASLRDALEKAVGCESRTSFVRAVRAPKMSAREAGLGAARAAANDLRRTRSSRSFANILATFREAPLVSQARVIALTAGLVVLVAVVGYVLRTPVAPPARASAPATTSAVVSIPVPVVTVPAVVSVPEAPTAPEVPATEVDRAHAPRTREATPRTDRPTPRRRPSRGTNGVYILD